MPSVYVPKYYFPITLVGYIVESSKDGKYSFEKLLYTTVKKDGTVSKDCKLTITDGNRACLKGIEISLTPILGAISTWEARIGTRFSIQCKAMLMASKLDPEGMRELALHATKPTILLADTPDVAWTEAEVEAIRPVGRKPSEKGAAPDASAPPVVNNSSDY